MAHWISLLVTPNLSDVLRRPRAKPRLAVAWIAVLAALLLVAACGQNSAAEAAADMGIDVYPGAAPVAVDWKFNIGDETIPGARFRTSDTSRKVHTWYHEKYPKNIIIPGKDADLAKLLLDPHGPDHLLLEIRPQGDDTRGTILIAINKEPDGGTEIILGRLTRK